jgi:hypothetical protein
MADYRVAYMTIVVKEVRRFLRIWVQTVLPAAISTSLYFLIFGHLIGERIGDMEGYRYIDFIVPGVIMMAIINNAYSNVVSRLLERRLVVLQCQVPAPRRGAAGLTDAKRHHPAWLRQWWHRARPDGRGRGHRGCRGVE